MERMQKDLEILASVAQGSNIFYNTSNGTTHVTSIGLRRILAGTACGESGVEDTLFAIEQSIPGDDNASV